METTQTINNPRYIKYLKGCEYALQLHKLYNIDDLGLINMIQQDDKFKKFIRKLTKKYYNIPKDDLNAIIEDILVDMARNRESIVVNYDQMISYTTKSIENRCKNYIRDQKTLKNGYDKDGNNLVSSFERHRNDLGELPFIDKKSMYEYEEVEFKMAMIQELNRVTTTKTKKRVALEYMLLVVQSGTVTDKIACDQIGCDIKTLKQAKTLLQTVSMDILKEL